MTKNEEYFAAVRLLMETTPNLSAKSAIKMVAKRKRINFEAVNTGYYRQLRVENGKAPRLTLDIISDPIKTRSSGSVSVKSVPTANGDLRDAAIAAFDAYEDHIAQREADVAKREQQMDELRAKIATLV